MNIKELSITDAAKQLRSGKLCSIDLVESCLDVIGRLEPLTHAWVQLAEDDARCAARQLDNEAKAGRWRGALHGIPIGVKDIIDVAGMPTKAGSPLRARHMAPRNAPVVARLKEAGAIVLGKTVTTQFACFDPAETTNPLDAARTPGGSSSGSAAAVACRMCFAALGTQTGGSIIRPASYCGITGLKPTRDAWPMAGIVPVSVLLDHVGPMAHDVEDLFLVWHADRSFEECMGQERVGMARPPELMLPQWPFDEWLESDWQPVYEAAVARLISAGVEIKPVNAPVSFGEVLTMHRRIMAFEAAQYHRESYAEHADQYAPNVAALVDEGLSIRGVDYEAALQHRRLFIHELAGQFGASQIWITPATTSAPPLRDTTGSPAMNAPWSYVGWPTVCFPGGWTEDSLPCGLQLVGPPGSEDVLLQNGRWCERVLAGFDAALCSNAE